MATPVIDQRGGGRAPSPQPEGRFSARVRLAGPSGTPAEPADVDAVVDAITSPPRPARVVACAGAEVELAVAADGPAAAVAVVEAAASSAASRGARVRVAAVEVRDTSAATSSPVPSAVGRDHRVPSEEQRLVRSLADSFAARTS